MGGLAPAAVNPGTGDLAAEADAAAEHQPAAAVPLPVTMEPAAPEAGTQQTASLSPKAEPAMPPQQPLVPESDQQTRPPSTKVEPGMPHLQQQQPPVRQGAAGAGTPAVKQEVYRAAMAASEKEGADVSMSAPKQESQDVEGHGRPATGAVGAAAAGQGSDQPKPAEQLAPARQLAEAVDEDDEPEEEEEEEEPHVSFGSPVADLSAVMQFFESSHCCPGR